MFQIYMIYHLVKKPIFILMVIITDHIIDKKKKLNGDIII